MSGWGSDGATSRKFLMVGKSWLLSRGIENTTCSSIGIILTSRFLENLKTIISVCVVLDYFHLESDFKLKQTHPITIDRWSTNHVEWRYWGVGVWDNHKKEWFMVKRLILDLPWRGCLFGEATKRYEGCVWRLDNTDTKCSNSCNMAYMVHCSQMPIALSHGWSS
jgi:hypothetical protein